METAQKLLATVLSAVFLLNANNVHPPPQPWERNDLRRHPCLFVEPRSRSTARGATRARGSPRSSAMTKLSYSTGLSQLHSATSPSPALIVWAAPREAAPLPFPLLFHPCPPPPAPPGPRLPPLCATWAPAPLLWEFGDDLDRTPHLSYPRLLEAPPARSLQGRKSAKNLLTSAPPYIPDLARGKRAGPTGGGRGLWVGGSAM